jgi:hypothetical protein
MSTQSDLVTYLQARAAELTFELDRLECLNLIERWNNAATALAAVQGDAIKGYSIAGRTVDRREVAEIQRTHDEIYGQIKSVLYGHGITLLDHRQLGGMWSDA